MTSQPHDLHSDHLSSVVSSTTKNLLLLTGLQTFYNASHSSFPVERSTITTDLQSHFHESCVPFYYPCSDFPGFQIKIFCSDILLNFIYSVTLLLSICSLRQAVLPFHSFQMVQATPYLETLFQKQPIRFKIHAMILIPVQPSCISNPISLPPHIPYTYIVAVTRVLQVSPHPLHTVPNSTSVSYTMPPIPIASISTTTFQRDQMVVQPLVYAAASPPMTRSSIYLPVSLSIEALVQPHSQLSHPPLTYYYPNGNSCASNAWPSFSVTVEANPPKPSSALHPSTPRIYRKANHVDSSKLLKVPHLLIISILRENFSVCIKLLCSKSVVWYSSLMCHFRRWQHFIPMKIFLSYLPLVSLTRFAFGVVSCLKLISVCASILFSSSSVRKTILL